MRNQAAYLWSVVGKIGPQVIYLLATMIMARFLTPDDFGKVGVLAIFISIASTLNDAGLSGSLVKEKKITKLDCATINVFNISVSLAIYWILFFSAPFIERFFSVDGLTGIVRCLCLVFLINSFATVPKALMVRGLRFKQLTAISFLSILIASIIAIVAAFNNCGAYSLVCYQLMASLVSSVCIIIITKYRFSIRFSIRSFKKLFSFGLFTTFTNIIDNIYENLLAFLFGKFLSIEQAGYLSQAKKLEDVSISACKDSVGSVSFPVLTRLRENKCDFGAEAYSITKNVILLVLPCLLVVAIYSKEVVVFAFGEKWHVAASYLSALMIAGFFMLIESAFRTYIKSLGNVARLAEYTLVKRMICVVLILLSALINPDLIVAAYIIGAVIGLLTNIILYSNIMQCRIRHIIWYICKYSMPSIICCGICQIVYVLCPNISIIATILIALAYIFILLPKFGLNVLKLRN